MSRIIKHTSTCIKFKHQMAGFDSKYEPVMIVNNSRDLSVGGTSESGSGTLRTQ